MALTDFQRRILRHLAVNRSASSYVAGGVVLNKDWPRLSDDIDIFHDTDEEIGSAADRDMAVLLDAGLNVRVDVDVYGVVEASVSDAADHTQIQWMSESRRRFLPLIRDAEWGARLMPADLAVNKVLAAATRTKARDFIDLVSIGTYLCPLGPIVMAAAGKPPFYSPQRLIDEIRRRSMSIWDEDYLSVKGVPTKWTPAEIRNSVARLGDEAEAYIQMAPLDLVGRLAIGNDCVPLEISSIDQSGFQLRAPTEEPDAIPEFKDTVSFAPPKS